MTRNNLGITPRMIEAYERIRASGSTNMIDWRTVSSLMGVPIFYVEEIQDKYEEYLEWSEFCKETNTQIDFTDYRLQKRAIQEI